MSQPKKKIASTEFPEHLYNLLFTIVPNSSPCSLVSNKKKDVHTMLFRDETNQQMYLLSIKPYNKEDYENAVNQ